jgi:hypothetical protein
MFPPFIFRRKDTYSTLFSSIAGLCPAQARNVILDARLRLPGYARLCVQGQMPGAARAVAQTSRCQIPSFVPLETRLFAGFVRYLKWFTSSTTFYTPCKKWLTLSTNYNIVETSYLVKINRR